MESVVESAWELSGDSSSVQMKISPREEIGFNSYQKFYISRSPCPTDFVRCLVEQLGKLATYTSYARRQLIKHPTEEHCHRPAKRSEFFRKPNAGT